MNIDLIFENIKQLFFEWANYSRDMDITLKGKDVYYTVQRLPMLNGAGFVITMPVDMLDFRNTRHETLREITDKVKYHISTFAKYHKLATEVRSEYFECDKYGEELKEERYMAIVSNRKDYRYISKYCTTEVEALLRAFLLYLKANKEGEVQ